SKPASPTRMPGAPDGGAHERQLGHADAQRRVGSHTGLLCPRKKRSQASTPATFDASAKPGSAMTGGARRPSGQRMPSTPNATSAAPAATSSQAGGHAAASASAPRTAS